MDSYLLQVNYGEDEAPVQIALRDCSADDAETERQALARQIEHAIDLDAPLIYTSARTSDPDAKTSIDPTRVTSVDLVAPVA
jgi:hypothetical protein